MTPNYSTRRPKPYAAEKYDGLIQLIEVLFIEWRLHCRFKGSIQTSSKPPVVRKW